MFLLLFNLKRIARRFTSGVEISAPFLASQALWRRSRGRSALAKLVVVVSFWLR